MDLLLVNSLCSPSYLIIESASYGSVIVFARHAIPCTGELSVTVDLSLLGAVVVSQLIDFFGLLCCCSIFRSTK